jgi:predicted ATP-dependent endonuclease of OLD family
MKAYIVCEGALDQQLLQRILPGEFLSTVGIVAAGSLSSVKSMARSLVVRRQIPVAIVVDADTVNADQVEERRREIKEIVESVAVNTPVEVILAVPAIETIFFQDPLLLSHLLGNTPSQEILSLAVYQPKQALTQLISQSNQCQSESQLVEQLTFEDLEILRKTPVFQEMSQFLQSLRETAIAS